MNVTRYADAVWKGDVQSGEGEIKFGSGAFKGTYTLKGRGNAEQTPQTNPEELIAAAHASCFTMALSHILTQAGHPPTELHTKAKVHLAISDSGFSIAGIDLETEGKVQGIDAAEFQKAAQTAKENCPVSKALKGVNITLKAKFIKE